MFFLFEWGEKPIAIAVIGRQIGRGVGKAYRGSRIVVLPDYQGFGIGSSISNFLAGVSKNNGYRYFTKTINPALGEFRNNHPNQWKKTAFNGKIRNKSNVKSNKYASIKLRPSYCHEYIGGGVSGYEELFLPINELRNKNQITLF
jgi:hypothetical protein